MSTRFYHHPDGLITITNGASTLMITLSEFVGYEPAYTLPAPYIAREYIPSVHHFLYTPLRQDGGPIPYTAGDGYIANIASYINQHNNPPRTVPQAKIDKIQAVVNYSIAKRNGNVNLFSTVMPSIGLDAAQVISYIQLGATPGSFYLNDINGAQVTLTLTQLNTYNNGVVQLHHLCDVNIDALTAAINALSTLVAIDAFDITTGWPTIPYTPV